MSSESKNQKAKSPARKVNRRGFIKLTSAATGGLALSCSTVKIQPKAGGSPTKPPSRGLSASALPVGNARRPLSLSHFPDRLHAFVWRNWPLVPVARMGAVVGATPGEIVQVGQAMGLPAPLRISPDQQRRSYITVIKRNWHLLPYEQLLILLDWTAEQLAYTLREDDFLFAKLGNLKPQCEPLRYQPPNEATRQRQREFARIIKEEFPAGIAPASDPLFSFVAKLSEKPPASKSRPAPGAAANPTPPVGARPTLTPRFCSSYFALYGDPLLETDTDPYPDGYLARLAECGVDGVWLQAVLYKLAPFPWDLSFSAHYEQRLKNLRVIVTRARSHGIKVYLYLNEPRAMPLAFFQTRPHLKGIVGGDHATLCTSEPEVQKYLTEAVASICRAVPDLGGFFTITASENLTNCWSHNGGANCPRCAKRAPGEVIAEVNGLFFEGIRQAAMGPLRPPAVAPAGPNLIAWDWGWADGWAEEIINRLPKEAALMSVSEWGLPIQRGGVSSVVGEYSISAIGPGPRAQRHWELARQRGLKTIAKIQAGNTWELSAVPYIPAVANVARHAANLREAKVDGLMLGWTLGGYPSPNLEVVAAIEQAEKAQIAGSNDPTGRALESVALRRFGPGLAPGVVQAWREFSAAFSEFPFHIGLVYSAPLQVGPANLLWAEPTGYGASMVGFPYDDLDGWRSIYPPEVFISQLQKVATGFDAAIGKLKALTEQSSSPEAARALASEISVAEAAAIHFRSTANQARFVLARRALAAARSAAEAGAQIDFLERLLREELTLAHRLHGIQSGDARIGFEASNQYYYVPLDLCEKVLNCRDLLDRWLRSERSRER